MDDIINRALCFLVLQKVILPKCKIFDIMNLTEIYEVLTFSDIVLGLG